MQWGLLAGNVCDRVKPPGKRRCKELHIWDEEQVRLFLAEAKRSSEHYPLYLALRTTGARPGELLGLREQDVDLVTGAITIRQKFYRLGGSKRDGEPNRLIFAEPKTDKGRRTIEIPPSLVEELRRVITRNQALRKEFGPSTATSASTARWSSANPTAARSTGRTSPDATSAASSSARSCR